MSGNSNNPNRGQNGNKSRGQKGGQKRPNKRRRKSSAKAARDFWGDPSKLPTEEPKVAITTAPATILESLGRPPLTGQEANAPHYFSAVYERAVIMAGALAAASNLVEESDDD